MHDPKMTAQAAHVFTRSVRRRYVGRYVALAVLVSAEALLFVAYLIA